MGVFDVAYNRGYSFTHAFVIIKFGIIGYVVTKYAIFFIKHVSSFNQFFTFWEKQIAMENPIVKNASLQHPYATLLQPYYFAALRSRCEIINCSKLATSQKILIYK